MNNKEKKRLIEIQRRLETMLMQNFKLDDVSIFADLIQNASVALLELGLMVENKSAEIIKTTNALASALFIAEKSRALTAEQQQQARQEVNRQSKLPDFLRRFTK